MKLNQEPVKKPTRVSGRKRLLVAASELFAECGVSEVTIAQILESSGVKAPTLYHHFGGKEGLYVAWAVLSLNSLKVEVALIQGAQRPFREYLEHFGKCLLDNKGIDLSQIMRDRNRLAHSDSADQIERAFEAAIINPFESVILAHSPSADGRYAAQLFIHLITGTRGRYRLSGLNKQPCVEVLVSFFMNGLLHDAESPVRL